MLDDAFPWTKMHAVIDGFRALLVPCRPWRCCDERALFLVPCLNAFHWHGIDVPAELDLQVSDGRFVLKKLVRLVANDVGIRGCVYGLLDECLEIVECLNDANLRDEPVIDAS